MNMPILRACKCCCSSVATGIYIGHLAVFKLDSIGVLHRSRQIENADPQTCRHCMDGCKSLLKHSLFGWAKGMVIVDFASIRWAS